MNKNYSSSSSSLSSSLTLVQQPHQQREEELAQNNLTAKDKLKEMSSVYKGLQTLFEMYLPRVDPVLIHDLLVREQQSPTAPFYMVEIFTKPGTNSEVMRFDNGENVYGSSYL